MKPIVTSSLAALAAALILGGCAVAPVDGSYAYGYARPYYYDNGPVYYETWPGYYPRYYYYGSPYYGSPAIVGSFRFGGGDRDHHWSGGSWRHNSFHSGDQTSRTVRAPRASTSRTATTRSGAASRARASRGVAHAHRDSDKS